MAKLRNALIYLITGLTLLANPIKTIAKEISRREINPTLTTTPPKIDGNLEEVWNQAISYSEFRKISVPNKGDIEKEPTKAMFLYNHEALYIGIQARKDLEQTVTNQTIADNIGRDDVIRIFIDPERSGSSINYFGSNLINTRLDGRLIGNNSIDWDDVHWESHSTLSNSSYTIEFKIPWRIIAPKSTDEFGINVIRDNPFTNESFALQFSNLGENDFNNYATLNLPSKVGKDNISANITPSITQEFRENSSNTSLGIDNLKVGYKNFSGSFTFNPSDDIIEADPHVSWNLTGDEINLPEKREFFSSSGALFNMGRQYFYSRRIGDLTFGGTETYEKPGLRVGLRNISAKQQDGESERYDIGRLILEKKIFGDVSNFGFYLVNTSDENIDKIGVVDWHLKKNQLKFYGEVAKTSGEGSNEENHALWSQFDVSEPGVYGVNVHLTSTGEKYNPQIGYQPIKGTKGVRIIVYRPFNIINIGEKEIYFNPYVHVEENQHQSGKFFSNYHYLSLGLYPGDGKLRGRYVIANGKRDLNNIIYSNKENIINGSYRFSPEISLSTEVYFGESYGYNFLSNSLNASYGMERIGSINFGLRRESIKNQEESKQDLVTQLQSNFNLRENLTFSTFLRHSSLYNQLTANARVGYNPTPSTELYLWTTSQTDLKNNNIAHQTNAQVNYTFDLTE